MNILLEIDEAKKAKNLTFNIKNDDPHIIEEELDKFINVNNIINNYKINIICNDVQTALFTITYINLIYEKLKVLFLFNVAYIKKIWHKKFIIYDKKAFKNIIINIKSDKELLQFINFMDNNHFHNIIIKSNIIINANINIFGLNLYHYIQELRYVKIGLFFNNTRIMTNEEKIINIIDSNDKILLSMKVSKLNMTKIIVNDIKNILNIINDLIKQHFFKIEYNINNLEEFIQIYNNSLLHCENKIFNSLKFILNICNNSSLLDFAKFVRSAVNINEEIYLETPLFYYTYKQQIIDGNLNIVYPQIFDNNATLEINYNYDINPIEIYYDLKKLLKNNIIYWFIINLNIKYINNRYSLQINSSVKKFCCISVRKSDINKKILFNLLELDKKLYYNKIINMKYEYNGNLKFEKCNFIDDLKTISKLKNYIENVDYIPNKFVINNCFVNNKYTINLY